MAWLWVGQASRVFLRLGDVTAVAAPGLLRHLPSTGDLGVKFIGAERSVYIRKELNSHRTGLVHQHGRHFIVLGHQYGCCVGM